MKILVVTPKVPWPASGADEQDRLEGIRFFIRGGHEVRVIAKVASYQEGKAEEMAASLGVSVTAVPYSRGARSFARLTDLRWLDGAAFEYTEPVIHATLESLLTTWKPDLVWLDASFSWPLISLIKRHGVRVVVRSLQIESAHVLVDEGYSIPNFIRFIGKESGERTLARMADAVVAINHHEADRYRSYGAKTVVTVPLRSLSSILTEPPIEYRDRVPLHILFSGSTFSVAHNRAGLISVVRDVAPALEATAPGAFVIHITGGKLPPGLTIPPSVRVEGYVSDYGRFVRDMDIAITPGLGRVGMHQKLYDPIARGIPTVTVPWALAGYPFEDAVLMARAASDFVRQILMFRDLTLRERLGRTGRAKAEALFSTAAIEKTLLPLLTYS